VPVIRQGKPLAQGMASWYGPGFHGRRTANGERYDMHALTAAHKTLPFGTKVRVRSVHTGKEVVVRINDRGPYKHSRIIDLSLGAISALGLRHRGVTEVVLLRE
jgi:rare lipoprotein A